MLQEAGETEVVLQIGESLLRERLPKAFKQDVVLAMALAYVDLSRDAMALDPPDFIGGCEVLERALKLLQVLDYHFLLPCVNCAAILLKLCLTIWLSRLIVNWRVRYYCGVLKSAYHQTMSNQRNV